ncbi:PepSY domain-containing protein [Devosia sp. XGJD_8]|uniref:PepSY domain-containing protein n=1 Tax=Devosia sp. XGJD_8 TaxID=3391187 RepID=UPI00398510A6
MTARLLIAVFLLLAAAAPTLAQGNSDGNGNAGNNGNGGNSGNAGNSSSPGNSDNPGNGGNGGRGNAASENAGNGAGNAGSGNNSGIGNGAGASEPGTPSPPPFSEPTLVPEEDILSMVQSGQAVSLSSLLPGVQARSGGQIIDAQLVRTPRILIYAVKVLTPDGRVGTEYYNARSGAYIEVR